MHDKSVLALSRVFEYLLMGGDMSNKSYIGLVVGSSANSSPVFALIGSGDEKLVFPSFRRYLVEIESNY